MSVNYNKVSVYMSKLLRHNPELAGLTVDTQGYTNVSDLLVALNITKEELDYIVASDKKGRYSYNIYGDKIRANQGHSLSYVKIDFEEFIPTGPLYHGTALKSLDSIMKNGLIPRTRNYVHLSHDINTAYNVGMRHAKKEDNLVILEVDAVSLYNNGGHFYISENGVVLIDEVPVYYLNRIR